jgi:hypothetical protein
MSNLPKLKVKWWSLGSQDEETTCDFEEAKDVIFGNSNWVLAFAEGEMISSYEELVKLAAQDRYKDKEVLNVTLIIPAIGGG